MKPLCFRHFFELVEKQPNYLDTIQDELGVDPETLDKSPEWAASISLGKISYNGIIYQIVRMVKSGNEVTGAMIKPLNVQGVKTQRAFIGSGDKQIRSPDSSVNSAEIFIPKDKLNALLTQGMGAGGAAGGGAGGGMPGGGAGGGMPGGAM